MTFVKNPGWRGLREDPWNTRSLDLNKDGLIDYFLTEAVWWPNRMKADIYFQLFVTAPLLKTSTINKCIQFLKSNPDKEFLTSGLFPPDQKESISFNKELKHLSFSFHPN